MASVATTRVPPSRVLLVASFGAFLAFLDATIVNVAFPSIRESFADTTIGELSWVLNAYNIVFAASLILCGRLTDLVGRRRSFVAGVARVHHRVRRVRPRPVGRVPHPGARRPGLRGGDARAGLARARHRGLPRGATGPRHRGVGSVGRGRRRRRPADRRCAGAAGRLALGLPRQPAVRPGRGVGRAARAGREPGARAAASCPTSSARPCSSSAWPCSTSASSRAATGGGPAPTVIGSFVGAAVALVLFVLSSRRHRAPMLDPTLLRLRSFDLGSVATVVAGFGFYAYLLTNVLWLQYVWGYDVLKAGLALVPGAVVAALVASRLGPLAERYGYRVFVVPGALVWAAAYLWYHQRVGLEPAFWAEWMPGQVLSGIGVGATLPLLGSATLAAVPGGRYATASAVASSARQLGGVVGIAILVVILGDPTPATVVDVAARGLGALDRRVPRRRGARRRPWGGSTRPLEDEDVADERPPVVLPPNPPADWALPSSVGSADELDLSVLPLFSTLPDAALHRLERATRVVDLPAGAVLIRQGDPAGSAFAVRTGRLEVLVGDTVVRELGPGQVLGELALLTGEPRSATVRARRDTTVVEIPREALEDVLATDPSAARFVLGQVADRLRTVGAGGAAPPPPERVSVVAVVGLGPAVSAADVAAVGEALHRRLRQHLRVATPGVVEPGRAGARRARPRPGPAGRGVVRRPGCRVARLLPAPGRCRGPRRERRRPRAGRGARPRRRPASPTWCCWGRSPTPAERAAWVAVTDAWQLTLVAGDLATGLRPVADRLAGRSLGLALAGGGARAFAHVGRAARARGGRPARRPGDRRERRRRHRRRCTRRASTARRSRRSATPSSCGAGRSATTGCRAAPWPAGTGCARRWSVTTAPTPCSRDCPRQLLDGERRPGQPHPPGAPARSPASTRPSPRPGCPCSSRRSPQDDGRLLVDGGVLDNLPTDLLVERDEGPVVAVTIGSGGDGPRRPGRPRVPGPRRHADAHDDDRQRGRR